MADGSAGTPRKAPGRLPGRGLHLLVDAGLHRSDGPYCWSMGSACQGIAVRDLGLGVAGAEGGVVRRARDEPHYAARLWSAGDDQFLVSADGEQWSAPADPALRAAACTVADDGDFDRSRALKMLTRSGVGADVMALVGGGDGQWSPGRRALPASFDVPGFGGPWTLALRTPVVIWAPSVMRYLAFAVATRGEPGAAGGASAVVMAQSADFADWSLPEVAMQPPPQTGGELRHIAVFRYAGLYLALAGVADEAGTALHMVVSRDGRAWHWCSPGQALVPPPQRGGMVAALDGMFLLGSRLRLYVLSRSGAAADHRLGVVELSRDRFMGVRPRGEGEMDLWVGPVEVEGRSLQVNVDASGGEARFSLHRPDGTELPRFALQSSDMLTSDVAHHTVGWGGRRDLSQELGRDVLIRLRLRQATAYAVTFLGGL